MCGGCLNKWRRSRGDAATCPMCRGKIPKAEEVFEEAFKLVLRAARLKKDGKPVGDLWKRAEIGLREYLQLKDDDARAWLCLATVLYLKEGRLDEAMKAHTRSLDLDPRDAGTLNNAGVCLHKH